MSFGVGLGDFVFVAKGAWTITSLLKGEAVDEFRRFERVYLDLDQLSRLINHNPNDPQYRNLFRRALKQIKRLRCEFRCEIERLRASLGQDRESNIRSCLEKVKWPLHAKRLEQIRHDLVSQLKFITMKQQFSQYSANWPFMEHLFMRDSFVLEDPFGDIRRLWFSSIDSWDALHQALLGFFPPRHRGHEIIQCHRYLLHKSRSLSEILCNSPGIMSIQDSIKPQELVIMSAIFPKLESDDRECPICFRERVANFQGPALQCPERGLWLHFHDSYSGQPDPLTQNAINNIKASGRAAFAFDFLQLGSPARNHPVDLGKLMWERIAEIGPIPPERTRAKVPKIKHFHRVTLCNPQWPEFSHNGQREKASSLLMRTKQGLQRTTEFLDSQDLPFAKAAAFVNTRFWFAREEQALLRFVGSSLQALTHSTPPAATPQNDARLLDDFVYRLESGIFDFLTARLEARCFLWMYWEVLQLEAKVLSSCAKLLDTWSCPDNYTRQETPLFTKVMTLPHIVLLVPWRLTFDLAEDIVDLFKRQPTFLPNAIQRLVTRSRNTSLYFYLYGGLSEYAQKSGDFGKDLTPDDRLCLHWMEEAIRSEGDTVDSELTREQIGSLIEGGHI